MMIFVMDGMLFCGYSCFVSLSHVVARAVVCIICICGDYLLWDISCGRGTWVM